mmetsp:Transcript_63091/g.113542  ORF Transcript_63091/g.113542 Transcript_63091/m.113542 type:complete len:227 (+) Transcript_63091:603-1283(+)
MTTQTTAITKNALETPKPHEMKHRMQSTMPSSMPSRNPPMHGMKFRQSPMMSAAAEIGLRQQKTPIHAARMPQMRSSQVVILLLAWRESRNSSKSKAPGIRASNFDLEQPQLAGDLIGLVKPVESTEVTAETWVAQFLKYSIFMQPKITFEGLQVTSEDPSTAVFCRLTLLNPVGSATGNWFDCLYWKLLLNSASGIGRLMSIGRPPAYPPVSKVWEIVNGPAFTN